MGTLGGSEGIVYKTIIMHIYHSKPNRDKINFCLNCSSSAAMGDIIEGNYSINYFLDMIRSFDLHEKGASAQIGKIKETLLPKKDKECQ